MKNTVSKQSKYHGNPKSVKENRTFSWYLTINIETKENNKRKEMLLLNLIESKLKKLLLESSKILELGKVNKDGSNQIHWLINNPNIDYIKFKPEIDKIKNHCSLFFNIEEVCPQLQPKKKH